MHTKSKINVASRLAARGTMLINRYLNNETFETYFNAQNEGKAADYLRANFSEYPENLGERLATYYNLCERLSAIGIESSKEVLLANLSDDESYSRAESGGVMKELAWLRSEFDLYPKPNQKTILGLLGEEIVLLRSHADLILSLDAELEILQQFDELPQLPPSDKELQEVIEGGNQIILGHELLKRLNPGQSGMFSDIPMELKQQLFASFQSYVVLDLQLNNELSEAEKRQVMRGGEAFVEYIARSKEPPMIGLLALMGDSAPSEYFESSDFVVQAVQVGLKYAQTTFISDLVHEALVRLFEYVNANVDRLRDFPAFHVTNLQIEVQRHLAESYEYLWETEKAVLAYKRMMRLAQKIGEQKVFQGGFAAIINCFEKHFEKEQMLQHLVAIIEHDNTFWQFPTSFEVVPTIQKTLELKLVDYLNETSISKRDRGELLKILRTEEAKVMVRLMQGIEEDKISSDSIKEAQKMVSGFYEKDLSGFFNNSTISPDEKVQALLEPLGFTDFGVEEYEKILDKIKPLENDISPYRQLIFHLHSAKLKYLKEEIDAVEHFNQYLPRLTFYNKEITMFQKGNWYNEKLRALSLVINIIPNILTEVEQTVEEALRLIFYGFLDEYGNQNAETIAIFELSNTIKALMISIDVCVSVEDCQRLLCMVWNVIVFKQQFLNRFLGKENISIPEDELYAQKLTNLRSDLSKYYFSKNSTSITPGDLQSQVYSLRKMEYPVVRDKHFNFEIKRPEKRSVLFTFFARMDDKRRVLVLSYLPGGHPSTGEEFDFKIHDDFEKNERFLEEFQLKSAYMWKRKGVLSVLEDPDAARFFADEFTHFLRTNAIKHLKIGRRGEKPIELNSENKSNINLYVDSFLHRFPLESLPDTEGKPLRLSRNINFVLNKPQTDFKIGVYGRLLLLGGVPQLPNFPFLKHSEGELMQIEQHASRENIEVNKFVGAEANSKNVKEGMRRRPSIVHFAVHGILKEELPPETSALVLSPIGNEAASTFLTFRDILDLDFHSVELVVLSACNSGIGKNSRGTPVQSLAYAFLQAGARFVIASRVRVGDETTAMIMSKFYDELFKSGDISLALRNTTEYFSNSDSKVSFLDLSAWGIWS